MQYQEVKPSSALSEHVECFWQLKQEYEPYNSIYDYMPPQGTYEIVFVTDTLYIKGYEITEPTKLEAGVWLIGQQLNCYQWWSNAPIYGIRIKPFALSNITKVSLHKIKKQAVPLESVIPTVSSEDYEKALQASSFAEWVKHAQKLMLAIIKDFPEVDELIKAQTDYILKHKGNVKIKDLCKEFGVNKVTLRNHFLKKVGLLPKELAKIWRLNNLLMLRLNNTDADLSELVIQAGYFDQPHFNNEFKSFFNITPARYFKYCGESLSNSVEMISKRFNAQYESF